jgi:RimJ/RimL family protein N-acetyltransferase
VIALPAPAWPLTDGVVALRRFSLDDVPAVTRACQDPEIPRWTAGIPKPYEKRHAREWIAQHDRFWNEDGRAAFAFCAAESGELFGSMTLAEIDFAARSATAGYWAAPWARNRGATTRALKLVCGWGFGSLGIDTVHLMTLPGNLASERVAEKAGFERVGTLDDYKPSRAIDPEARYRVNRWILRGDPGDSG